MNMNDNTQPSDEDPWRLYDFERDGLDVFDGRSCDYYLLCYTDGSLDNGIVIKALSAGPEGLISDRDASGAFGMVPIDPRNVAAYVEIRRPELSEHITVALARARKKVVFWHQGVYVGAIEAKRPREQLGQLHARGFAIADGNVTVFDGQVLDVPEDAYWVDETLAVTPLRIDVSVVSTTEKIVHAEEAALQSRSDSERRQIKRVEKRTRRANERRLLELGTTFDKTRAMNAIAMHAEKLTPFGLLDEYDA